MFYGQEKRREMARSILPSRARTSSKRDLQGIRRKRRRAVAQKLRMGLEDLGDDTGAPDRLIKEQVYRRRSADKLNHFERWAVAVTRALPVDDRLSTLRAWLPDGLIGDHAMSHLEWIADLRPVQEHDWRFHWYRPEADAALQQREQAELAAALRTLWQDGHHADLNAALRRAGSSRLLLGLHDAEAFVHDVVRCRRRFCPATCDHTAHNALVAYVKRVQR